MTVCVKLRRGAQIAQIKETPVEIHSPGKGYHWTSKLAIVDLSGRWMYSQWWHLNQKKAAIARAKELGWEVV